MNHKLSELITLANNCRDNYFAKNKIMCTLYDAVNTCEHIYYENVLRVKLNDIWCHENSVLQQVMVLIYINISTLSSKLDD